MGDEYLLECSGITKSFGGTHALKGVELHVKPGRVHALLGENGAGKSTLMKCIVGLYKADAGSMNYRGEPYAVKSIAEALNKGISMIHQELNPEPYLSVADNIFLHREFTNGIFLNKKKQNEEAQKILDDFGFGIKATTLMGKLTLAQCQMVEIIKAVSVNASIIIMDEPTSSLDSNETERLFSVIRDLRDKGVAIIYISHRMEEIFEICDEVSIFRDGNYVGNYEMSDVDSSKLISLMVGREVSNVFPKVDCEIGDEVFRVDGLTGNGFTDISFAVHSGEILGLVGLVGSGRSETMRAIFGLDPIKSGKMYLEGKEVHFKNPGEAIEAGVCMVNEDRKTYGLCLHRSIRENISLPNLKAKQRGPLLNQKKEKAECAEVAKMLAVKAGSLEDNAYSLSGGNQQKVVLAKWIMARPKLLILDEPTRGVDVGAKSELHALMSKFAGEGMAVIMISSEMPEIMGMSDRILVYYEGHLNGELSRAEIVSGETTQEDILQKQFGT